MKEHILLIEDDRLMRATIEDALKASGYSVTPCETGEQALQSLQSNSFAVAITDVRLPDTNGLDIVRQISAKSDTQVVVMTAFGTIKNAVEAMKLGAYDYITKPFSLDEFLLIVERAIEVQKLRNENIRLRKDLNRCYSFPNIIAESIEMQKVFSLVGKVSETDSTVLIHGESGTGKELIATTLHYQSKRKAGPLVKVNCAALPENLIESELFGYEKGAFTGAQKQKPGRFELADKGTIFLDEVGDLTSAVQAKLLRVLQEQTFERVGGTATLTVDARVIAATNKDLEDEVRKGAFREDLYYRINVVPIFIPPLRERREDIPYLIEFFVDSYCKRFSRNVRFSKEAFELLLSYDYPGNVRELKNIIERSVALSMSGVIGKDELPSFIAEGSQGTKSLLLTDVTADAVKTHILKVLRIANGNKTRAAGILGISRKTLWEKMNSYGIE